MKSILEKILPKGKGRPVSSQTLQTAKAEAESTLSEKKDRAQAIKADLVEARLIEDAGEKADVKKLEKELETLNQEIEVLELALVKFDEKILATRQDEISKRLAEIDQEISLSKDVEPSKIDEFLEAAGKAAGLYAAITTLPKTFEAGGVPNRADGDGWVFPALLWLGSGPAGSPDRTGQIQKRKKIFIEAFFSVNDSGPGLHQNRERLSQEFFALRRELKSLN